MKGRTKAIILMGGLLGLLLFAICGVAMAAQTSQTVTVNANVGQALQLSVSKGTVDFGGGVLDPAVAHNDSLVATVSSNKSWTLQVSKDQDLTSATDVIASANLTFTSTSSDGHVTPGSLKAGAQFGLAASPTVVAAGTKAGGININVAYTLASVWGNDPGLYTAQHTYTAIAP